jgi:hypothetical protein
MKILTEIETYWNGFQWFEVLDGLLGPYWKALGLAFNCTFLLFGSVIQLIACARLVLFFLLGFCHKFGINPNMISFIFGITLSLIKSRFTTTS